MISPETANAIKKSKYCRCIDTKQWRLLESLAMPDATLVFKNPDGSIQSSGSFRFEYSSPKGFILDLQKLFKRAQTLHNIGMGDLKELDNGDVEAVWSMEDQIIYPSIIGIPLEVRGGDYYYEIWRKIDGEWKLKSLQLERTYVRPTLAAQLLAPLSSLL